MQEKGNYIFISYAHRDAEEVVHSYVNKLAERHNVWIDEEQLDVGGKFTQEIAEAIENCACFLAFRSRNYDNSEYCFNEITYALSKFKHGEVKIILLEADYDREGLACGKALDLSLVSYTQIIDPLDAMEKLNHDRDIKVTEARTPWRINHTDRRSIYKKPLPIESRFAYNSSKVTLDLVGRERELKRLRNFMDCEKQKAFTVITGQGGSGKSKLCSTFADQMHANGWDVYYIANLATEKLKELINGRPGNNTFIIIDYTFGNQHIIKKYLNHLYSDQTNALKTRVLFLERDYSRKDEDIKTNEKGELTKVDNTESYKPQFVIGKENEFRDMRYNDSWLLFKLDALSKEDIIQVMMDYIRESKANATLNKQQGEQLYKTLQAIDPDNQRPLYALFIADAWMNHKDPRGWSRDEALDYVVKAEQAIWLKTANIEEDTVEELAFIKYLMDLVATITFHGGMDYEKATDICGKQIKELEKFFASKPRASLEKYLVGIGMIHQNEDDDYYFDAIRPDLVGEWVVLDLLKNKRKAKALFKENWFNDSGITQFLMNLIPDFEEELTIGKLWGIIFNTKYPLTASQKIQYVAFIASLVAALKNHTPDEAIQTAKILYEDNPSDELALHYSKILSRKCLDYEEEETLDHQKALIEQIHDLYQQYSNSELAKDLALQEAVALRYTTRNKPLEVKRQLFEKVNKIYLSYKSKKTAEQLAWLWFYMTVDNTLEGKRECVDGIRGIYGECHTEAVAEQLAKAWYNLTVGNTLEGTRECVDGIRGIYGECHTEAVAEVLAKAWFNLTVGNTLGGKRECVDGIRGIYGECHTEAVAEQLAMAIGNSIRELQDLDEAEDWLDFVRNIYLNEFHVESIAEGLCHCLSSEVFGRGRDIQRRNAKEIQAIYDNEFQNKKIAVSLSCALGIQTVDAGYEKCLRIVEKTREIFNEWHVSRVAIFHAFNVINLSGSCYGEERKRYVDEAYAIYEEFPEPAIAEVLPD